MKEQKPRDSWWGKLIFEREGVVIEREFETRAEAEAYNLGVNDTIEYAGEDLLDEYFGDYSQIEAKEE